MFMGIDFLQKTLWDCFSSAPTRGVPGSLWKAIHQRSRALNYPWHLPSQHFSPFRQQKGVFCCQQPQQVKKWGFLCRLWNFVAVTPISSPPGMRWVGAGALGRREQHGFTMSEVLRYIHVFSMSQEEAGEMHPGRTGVRGGIPGALQDGAVPPGRAELWQG